jgi:uncharacterized membrane protein YjfL (UPF0719 family)
MKNYGDILAIWLMTGISNIFDIIKFVPWGEIAAILTIIFTIYRFYKTWKNDKKR